MSRYPDKVAFLRDGWAVRFNGCIERARWTGQGAAQAHLDLLQAGLRDPDPEPIDPAVGGAQIGWQPNGDDNER